MYFPTIVTQWILFLLIYVTTYRERTGLKGIGFTRIKLIHLLWAIAFLLISNLLLSLLSLLLSRVDIAIPGELGLLLPKNAAERVVWVVLSITAGIVEETVFRPGCRLITGIWSRTRLSGNRRFHYYLDLRRDVCGAVYTNWKSLAVHYRPLLPGFFRPFLPLSAVTTFSPAADRPYKDNLSGR